MKKIIILLFTISPIILLAQVKPDRAQRKADRALRVKQLLEKEEEGTIAFSRQTVFGVKANTDGYGIFIELGRMQTVRRANLFSLEIAERKHPKEDKLTTVDLASGFQIGNPFIYGKRNNFYLAKLGYAQQRLIGGKGIKNGVAVSGIFGGGLTAGLLKPYYLRVVDGTGQEKDIKYSQADSAAFLDVSDIVGAAGFGKGFNQIKFVPGLHAKGAFRFDYGRYNELVSALEVGIQAEYYTQKMPIMLLNKEKRFFFNAYISLLFGRRK